MFNLELQVSPSKEEGSPPCIHVPKDTPIEDITSFFDVLGFRLTPVFNSGDAFFDVINVKSGESFAWVMISGSTRLVQI